jgi:hypothetical protein
LKKESRLYDKINEKSFLQKLKGTIEKIIKTIDYDYMKDNIKVIYYSLNGYPEPKTYHLDNGYLIYNIHERDRRNNNFDLQKRIDKTIPPYKKRFSKLHSILIERRNWFEEFLEITKEKDIELRIFITTIHPQGVEILRKEANLNESYMRTINFLDEYDVIYWDFSTIETFEGDIDGFYDVGHIDEFNSNLVIEKVLEDYGKRGVVEDSTMIIMNEPDKLIGTIIPGDTIVI